MLLQTEEQQRLLVDQRVSTDLLRDEENASTYNTFRTEAPVKQSDNVVLSSAVGKSDDPGYTWKTIFMIMSTWIGVFLASVDMSVMATLTGPISESFSSFHLLTWFINAYTITTALVQPLSGKLSDIYGRRNCLLVSNFAFLLGNLLCGLATKPWHFILGRAIGGLGGGCLHSISTFLASDMIPLRARGFWQGVSNIAFGSGFAIGGVLGGLINDTFGWKWAFLFQPFPILVSMLLVFWLVPKSTTPNYQESPSIRQIDFAGSITLTMAILSLMWGAVSGGNTFAWSSPIICVPLALFPILLAAFVYVEDKVAKDPVIPVRQLANRTVLGACLTNFLCTTGNTALVFYLPMTMETQGLSPAQAGLRQIPNAAGAFLGSMGVGAMMNLTGKYYWFCLFAVTLMFASGLTTLLTLENITGWYTYVLFFMNGSGMGGMLVTTLLALISAADHKQHAVLTAASYAFRTAGNTLGITVAGAIFQNIFSQQLWARLGDRKDADRLIPAIRRRQIELNDLPAGWKSIVLGSYNVSYHAVFAFIAATYILGLMTASVIRENRLHSTLDRK